MTTLAFAGGVMAIDSFATGGGAVLGLTAKLLEIEGRWFALLGELADAHRFARGLVYEAEHLAEIENGDIVCELLSNSKMRMYAGKGYVDFEAQTFAACGSGGKAAMALMHAGIDPVSAVRYTSKVDIYTGGPIRAVRYDNVEQKFVSWESK